MSQVKNLRAMFEQRGELSPPDRGRTPGGTPVAVAPESPRPLSRVRTNFIAVEKDGRMGLQRDPSVDSSLSTSRHVSGGGGGSELSFTAPSTPQLLAESKRGPVELPGKTEAVGVQTPARTPPGSLVAPARQAASPGTPTVSLTPPAPLPTAAEIAAVNAEAKTQTAGTGSKLFASRLLAAKAMETQGSSLGDAPVKSAGAIGLADTASVAETLKAALNGPAATAGKHSAKPLAAKTSGASHNSHPRPTLAAAHSKNTSSGEGKIGSAKTSPTTAAAPASTGSKHAPKTISTTKANARASAKTSTAKTPTSPAKPLTPKLATKTPEKKTGSATEKSSATTTPKQPATTARKPSPLRTLPHNGTGFVKPKPKSPTKPMQLPPGLTTHTTASATKLNAPRQTLSRMSGNYPLHQQPVARSASRNSISTATSSAGGTRALKRQNSTINRPRPSIGPPPKPAARDHPVTKKEKEIDEGFLARMMRPTQASASKTVDKTQLPVVRKHQPVATTKPHTSDHGVAVQKHAGSETAKKVVSKTLAVRTSAAPSRAPSAAHSHEGATESAAPETVKTVKKALDLAPAVKAESQTAAQLVSRPVPEAVGKPTEEPTTELVPEIASKSKPKQSDLAPETKPEPVSEPTPAPEQEETGPVPGLMAETVSEPEAKPEPEPEPRVEAKPVDEEVPAQAIPVLGEKAEAVETETILDTTEAAQPEPAPHVDTPSIIEDNAGMEVQAAATTDEASEETENAAMLEVHVNGIETY